MEQLYEMWLKSQKPEKGEDPATQTNKENGKQIHMPTDYAEVTVSHREPAGALLDWCLLPSPSLEVKKLNDNVQILNI